MAVPDHSPARSVHSQQPLHIEAYRELHAHPVDYEGIIHPDANS